MLIMSLICKSKLFEHNLFGGKKTEGQLGVLDNVDGQNCSVHGEFLYD